MHCGVPGSGTEDDYPSPWILCCRKIYRKIFFLQTRFDVINDDIYTVSQKNRTPKFFRRFLSNRLGF